MGPGHTAAREMAQADTEPGRPTAEELTAAMARADKLMQDGWTFRFDLERGEYYAARELHRGRTLEQLVEKVEKAEKAGEPR